MVDSHGRTIRDLRLSVTDRCNFRCVYCMDPDFRYMPKRELLSASEFLRAARVCRSLGIEKLRITGGEPTLYPQLDQLLGDLGRLGFDDIAITTNGSRMDRSAARRWKSMGVSRITLSLDTLRNDRVTAITRARTTVESAINAIEAAHHTGLTPVKVNAVVMRGVNDDEVADFAEFARQHDVVMRFIEWMPLDSGHEWGRAKVVPAREILDRITERYPLWPRGGERDDSTAMNYVFADGAPGAIGLIAPVSNPFCGACSRLRITADGKVRPCLFSHSEWDLRPLLRQDATTDADLASFITDAVWTKQAGHGINSDDFVRPQRTMSAIGG